MIEAYAKTKYIRVSPKKARIAADLIRGMKVEDAFKQLMFCNLKSGKLLNKTLKSAVANAETQFSIQRKDLRIKNIRVDEGPTMKRSKSRSRGRRTPIMKRMSHFTIIVGAELK